MYVVEREIPGAGKLSADEVQGIIDRVCEVLRTMGPEIQWLESFVTENKVYCIYLSPDEETLRVHAQLTGFPANSIREVMTVLDPATAS